MLAQGVEVRLEKRRPRQPRFRGRTVRLHGPEALSIGDKPFPQGPQGDQIIAFCAAQLWAKAKKDLITQHGHIRNAWAVHKGVLESLLGHGR